MLSLLVMAWCLLDGEGPVTASVVPVAGEEGGPVLCAPGLVEPAGRVIPIRAPVPGRLVEVPVEPGQLVEPGQVLAALDHDHLEAALAIRQAEARAAEFRLDLLRPGQRAEEVEAARSRLTSAEEAARAAEAHADELAAGVRPEDLEVARARLEELRALEADAIRTCERHRRLVPTGAMEESRLGEAETAVAVAGARVRQASAELARLEAGERPEAIERARAEASSARARVREAAAELARLENGARPEELAIAWAEVEAAAARVAAARSDLEDAFLRSPLAGLVVYRHRNPGEEVSSADPTPILELASAGALHVRADVDEFDVARVREGQTVRVGAPAFGERRFPGRVVRIERIFGRRNFDTELPTEKRDARILEVVIALEAPAEGVLPLGMPVRVEFLPAER